MKKASRILVLSLLLTLICSLVPIASSQADYWGNSGYFLVRGDRLPSGVLPYGKVFKLTGTVENRLAGLSGTPYYLNCVQILIRNSNNGSIAINEYQYFPSTSKYNSYNLSGLDYRVHFEWLKRGEYYLYIVVQFKQGSRVFNDVGAVKHFMVR